MRGFREYYQVSNIARQGGLVDWLLSMPRAQWHTLYWRRYSLIHMAVRAEDERAVRLLLSEGVDANAITEDGEPPIVAAVTHKCTEITQLLCAAGANLRINWDGFVLLDFARRESARVLLANGLRLRAPKFQRDPELAAFERVLLARRSAVAALLLAKRVGRLVSWDKFLLRQVALELWADRMCGEW